MRFPNPLPDKLHLGSAHLVQAGWLNTDVTRQIQIARVPLLPYVLHKLGRMSLATYAQHQAGVYRQVYYLDVTRRFPFPDASFGKIYSSHMLEHLFRDEGEGCIREIYRVLTPGGRVRLALPDLDYIVRSYDPQDVHGFLTSIYQGETRSTHPRARHWWHYNWRSLTHILEAAGFTNILVCSFQHGPDPEMAQMDNRPSSLIVEAGK